MLDLSHIPNSQQDVQIFYSNGVANAWQTWQKPRKCNYVWIMCIGSGGGGGGGYGSSTTLGGAGGGGGAITRVLYNAQQLPDVLYVQVGVGGAGGAGATAFGSAGSNGSSGQRSFVSLQPVNSVAQNLVTTSGGGAAAGGSGAGGGGVTAAESAGTQASATFYTLGNFISTNGQPTLAFPTQQDITPFTSQLVTPGAGGMPAGNTSAAGNIFSSSISPLIPGGAGATASGSNGENGANGITSFKPFFSTGGAGGGNSVSGSGGNGGNGGIGSGGGGGGSARVVAGVTTGGRGGRGGDGLVVIISF